MFVESKNVQKWKCAGPRQQSTFQSTVNHELSSMYSRAVGIPSFALFFFLLLFPSSLLFVVVVVCLLLLLLGLRLLVDPVVEALAVSCNLNRVELHTGDCKEVVLACLLSFFCVLASLALPCILFSPRFARRRPSTFINCRRLSSTTVAPLRISLRSIKIAFSLAFARE